MQAVIILLSSITRAFRLEPAPGHEVWPLHRGSLRPEGGMPMIIHRRAGVG
jgi:hypothetical protein